MTSLSISLGFSQSLLICEKNRLHNPFYTLLFIVGLNLSELLAPVSRDAAPLHRDHLPAQFDLRRPVQCLPLLRLLLAFYVGSLPCQGSVIDRSNRFLLLRSPDSIPDRQRTVDLLRPDRPDRFHFRARAGPSLMDSRLASDSSSSHFSPKPVAVTFRVLANNVS